MSDELKQAIRKDDSPFSEGPLDKLTSAGRATDDLRFQIPLQIASQSEDLGGPHTKDQKRVAVHMAQLATDAAKKLGTTRRQFMTSTGGMALAFVALNQVFGRFFNVRSADIFIPSAYAETGAPSNLFVFDDQLHMMRESRTGVGNSLRDIAKGSHNRNNPKDLSDELERINYPWNPALEGVKNVNENFHLVQFVKDVYVDSQVAVGIMTNNNASAIPDYVDITRPSRNVFESEANEILTVKQTMQTRDWINTLAGSRRMLGHGQLYVGLGNLDFIQYQIDELKPDSWEGCNIAAAAKLDTDSNSYMDRWRLDDEAVAYPTYELIVNNRVAIERHPGLRNICIHKGLSSNASPQPELGHPSDIPKAASDWPMLNFIIYHSCLRPGFWVLNALNDLRSGRMRDGVPDILWTTEFAVLAAPFSNVYAELGTTFASSVITFPTVCAHIIGQLLKFMGEDRVIFGSDSVWYGSPQWQIEALWRFQIPEDMRRKYGYPELTEAIKRKILGMTSAKLYKIRAESNVSLRGVYKPFPTDYESSIPDSLKAVLEFPGVSRTG